MIKQTKDHDDNERKAKVLQDGERLRTPMYAMDSVQKSIADNMHPSLSKLGYRFVTDSEARQRIDDAHAVARLLTVLPANFSSLPVD